MTTWAEQQRKKKIAEIVRDSRARDRRAQDAEYFRIESAERAAMQERNDDAERQELAEDAFRLEQHQHRLAHRKAAENSDHERRMAALRARAGVAPAVSTPSRSSQPATRSAPPVTHRATTPSTGPGKVLAFLGFGPRVAALVEERIRLAEPGDSFRVGDRTIEVRANEFVITGPGRRRSTVETKIASSMRGR